MTSLKTAVLAFLVLVAAVPAAGAAELLMLEQPGCAWCARFNAEIAPAWPKTEEGRRAPLRRVDITEPWPDDLKHVARERFTPTFVLMEDGKEIGRGLSLYDAVDAVQIMGKRGDDIEAILGYPPRRALVHRDDMVLS